ncbi:hypothetical protein FOMG_18468 [Fusarium oxysporum f. sp. melonis 26406]|uniref:Uncharacterized protein n=1 Tax=Fusarium oxysporum f. sp. melonis 26406 TaxID=1089452 RepID=W9ZUQ3_FUSOX|nr:hypothetical protein FOMG_18468 [Fusarium oxysporum f. sp. melonis 26406]
MHHSKYMHVWHFHLLHDIGYYYLVFWSWVGRAPESFFPFRSGVLGVYRRASFICFSLSLRSAGDISRGLTSQGCLFNQYGVATDKASFLSGISSGAY